MLVTLVIRLVPEELAKGELVGQIEHIGSGERVAIRNLDELVSFARRHADHERREPLRSGL